MECPNQLIHVIKKGDNLYQLSKYYQTTVSDILSKNPGLDPYSLQVARKIIICPGSDDTTQADNVSPSFCPNPSEMIALRNHMRLIWSQHVYWTRMLIISIVEQLKDQDDVTKRLLRNPGDLARLFAQYYSGDVKKTIENLLTEHLKIGAELITALRDGKTHEADMLERNWYHNADQMAKAFSEINPYYNEEDLKHMFYSHLMITKEETLRRIAGKYNADIETFDKAEHQMMQMADYLAQGIISQLPQEFIGV